MKQVIIGISIFAAALVSGGTYFYKGVVPAPVPTAVIGEKPDRVIGNQFAVSIPQDLSANQTKLLKIAYKIAKEDGHKNPEIVQAILLQETRAGSMKNFRVVNPGKDAYFGLLQIKVSAARDVLSRHPSLWTKYNFHTTTDDEIKANLILNDYFNLEVGSKYLLLLKRQYGFSGRKLLNAYNRGPGGVANVDDNFHYAIGAEKKLAQYKAGAVF